MTDKGKKSKPKAGADSKKTKNDATEAAAEKLIESAEETMQEMRDAMGTMMSSSAKMMQAFVDMRLSYLKVMRAGLEDPATAMDIATRSAGEIAKSLSTKSREE
jgi:hypothetical protein